MNPIKTYKVKECFLTLQGEGHHAGRAAVFIRMAGCNFWSGNPAARASSECPFCDTDFVGTDGTHGGKYDASELVRTAVDLALEVSTSVAGVMVVLTGGEPLLQVDAALVSALKAAGFFVAVETNGSMALPPDRYGLNWVCCSPKNPARLKIDPGHVDELKVVYPAQVNNIAAYDEHLGLAARRWVQPEGTPGGELDFGNCAAAVEFVQRNPIWRLSFQMHKALGLR